MVYLGDRSVVTVCLGWVGSRTSREWQFLSVRAVSPRPRIGDAESARAEAQRPKNQWHQDNVNTKNGFSMQKPALEVPTRPTIMN